MKSGRWAAVLSFLLGGCGLILDLDGTAETPDGAAMADAGSTDADADADADVRPPDPCEPGWLAGGVIAEYEFDGTLMDARGGDAEGSAVPEGSATYTADGRCGQAVAFEGPEYILIPNRERWNDVRSIDFWVLSPTAPENAPPRGILSRDAFGLAGGGHLTVARSWTNRISARLQADMTLDHQEKRCSDPLELSGWVHVGINIGPPGLELWVNGAREDAMGVDEGMEDLQAYGCSDDVVTTGEPPTLCCTTSPWIVGAANHRSTEGATDMVRNYMRAGAVDRLRFSTARRDFRSAAP